MLTAGRQARRGMIVRMIRKQIAILALVAAVACGAGFGSPGCSGKQKDQPRPPGSQPARNLKLVATTRRIPQVLGTFAQLIVVAPQDKQAEADRLLGEVEKCLRDVEAKMSARLADSELSRLNKAPVGELVTLSADTLEVLKRARDFATETQGAFDVTCRPILQLWQAAGKRKSLPTQEEIQAAVADTGWRWFELTGQGAIRKRAGASIDLGGIGKKYAIDQAAGILAGAAQQGGDSLVAGWFINVGGDIRCAGRRAEEGPWHVAIRNPFSSSIDDRMAVIKLTEGSVCTSGNYERFTEIDGRRFSHIVDPRTGWPCDAAPSVTVVGRDALTAGLWATALSVLGRDGARLMPPGLVEVMIVEGAGPQDADWYRTPGFDVMFVDRPDKPPAQWVRHSTTAATRSGG